MSSLDSTSIIDDLTSFSCLNPACKDYGRRGAGNLRVHSRAGRE